MQYYVEEWEEVVEKLNCDGYASFRGTQRVPDVIETQGRETEMKLVEVCLQRAVFISHVCWLLIRGQRPPYTVGTELQGRCDRLLVAIFPHDFAKSFYPVVKQPAESSSG